MLAGYCVWRKKTVFKQMIQRNSYERKTIEINSYFHLIFFQNTMLAKLIKAFQKETRIKKNLVTVKNFFYWCGGYTRGISKQRYSFWFHVNCFTKFMLKILPMIPSKYLLKVFLLTSNSCRFLKISSSISPSSVI